jgi:hypothetical protein
VKAYNAEAVAEEGFGHRGHDSIHSRSGTAARQYSYALHGV